ncbi:MAG: hypothetical protein K9N21_06460 [Deltaproteobacteria bacterium]|nr:hypothetical protein [Deltaproteobacteria bacterium]
MTPENEKKPPLEAEVLSLFPIPFYTGRGIYFEEDLKDAGLTRALEQASFETGQMIFKSAEMLASIKPELAFHFLLQAPELLNSIDPEELRGWTRTCLEIYDAEGLIPAREFIVEHKDHPAFQFHRNSVSFEKVSGILQNFLHSLGGSEICLQTSAESYTDSETIFVPETVSLFSDTKQNFLLYKLSIAHKMAQLELGTYRFDDEALFSLHTPPMAPQEPPAGFRSRLSFFFQRFTEPHLARDLFLLADTLRAESWIRHHLPGLFRRMVSIKKALSVMRADCADIRTKTGRMEALIKWYLSGCPDLRGDRELRKVLAAARDMTLNSQAMAEITRAAYACMPLGSEPYGPVTPVPYVGVLKPEEAETGLRRRRESRRLNFQKELAKLVEELPDPEDIRLELPEAPKEMAASGGRPQRQEVPDHLIINDGMVPVPDAMHKIIREIYEDLGSIPSAYLTVADDMTGHYFHSRCQAPEGTGYFFSETAEGIHVLDEWDYRRQGYRKRWALLRESDAEEGDLAFIEETMDRYGAMAQQIKRRFECIRQDQTLLRRQKEGDEVDLDAAVEALSDMKAGQTPSERVFVRLNRQHRDIATAFLIDLSGSTSGWINETERMALLILCEAMDQIEDRFSIYGFSGQTRKRCELFRIKGFEEPYGDRIKKRIASIRAREYTRMGPPIRRLTEILGEVDARSKLLLTLSDGKPDDYDAYSGDYGIEDTRQALAETRKQGIHPFCITIDKAEHSYLAHMYGHTGYVFIDNLAKLPLKVPEIYRKLTT